MSIVPSGVVLSTSFPGLANSAMSSSDITDREPKKRRRPPQSKKDVVSVREGSQRPRGKPRTASKGGVTAAHEVRMLRAQVASMEEELQGLKAKWTTTIPDERTLTAAYRSALKRYAVIQTEATRRELQQTLLEQQLLFATFQAAICRAPLHSSGKEIHDMLHFDTHLGRDSMHREEMLMAHHKRALGTLPAIMNHLTQVAIDKSIAERGELTTPLSQMEITGCADCTLISSVFMSEIPHTSLEEVYGGVLAFFDSIPKWMKRHFGGEASHIRLNRPDSPVIYWRSTLNAGLPAVVNHIVCSELTSTHGTLHMDAITNDPLNPVPNVSPLQYGICGLTITPRKDPRTGRTVAVSLRWATVYRYNIMPNDPAIKQDLEIVRPILNGDLITAVVCSYIQEKHPVPKLAVK